MTVKSSELKKMLEKYGGKAAMDIQGKKILRNKSVLAALMRELMDECGERELRLIAEMILEDNRALPGTDLIKSGEILANESIRGLNPEFSDEDFGTAIPDLVFKIRDPKTGSQTLASFDLQERKPAGYEIPDRQFAYIGRLITAQKGIEYQKSEYSDQIDVLCSFIQLRAEENLLLKDDRRLYGFGKRIRSFLIAVSKNFEDHRNEKRVHLLIKALFYDEVEFEKRMEILESFGIETDEELKEDIQMFSGLGSYLVEQGRKEAMKQGLEEGLEKGIEKGIEKGMDKGKRIGEETTLNRISLLASRLKDEHRSEELFKALEDGNIQHLMDEYGIH